MKNVNNITLALAGVAQACSLINELAVHGNCNNDDFQTLINTVYKIDSGSTLDVYGDPSKLALGLEVLKRFLGQSNTPPAKALLSYLRGILVLEKKLRKNQELTHQLKKKLDFVLTQVNYFSGEHEQVIASLADVYKTLFSTLNYRIIIRGNPDNLKQNDIMIKIRALLLAGIRSAVLWRQLGGTGWQLLFQRKALLKCVNNHINQ